MKGKVSLFLAFSLFSEGVYAVCPNINPDITKKLIECDEKYRSVQNKEHLFTGMKGGDRKKRYYLHLIDRFKKWLEQSRLILQNLEPEEMEQNLCDFSDDCQQYTKQISDFLYWAQGKTPPGGFGVNNPDIYFGEQLKRDS